MLIDLLMHLLIILSRSYASTSILEMELEMCICQYDPTQSQPSLLESKC